MIASIALEPFGPELQSLLRENDLPISDLTGARVEFYVSRSGSAVLGMVGLEQCVDATLLRSLAVANSVRGLGIGTALVRHAEAVASSRTFPAIYLLTTTAEQFFRALGYRVIPRSEVPASIAATAEFSSLCPASSTLMKKVL